MKAIDNIEHSLPFELKGFDCDNGSEFLNWHLYRHFTVRKQPVKFTRSRAYYKNDNAHVEEKNWTNIRQYLGYSRFDKQEIVGKLNELYNNKWRLSFDSTKQIYLNSLFSIVYIAKWTGARGPSIYLL